MISVRWLIGVSVLVIMACGERSQGVAQSLSDERIGLVLGERMIDIVAAHDYLLRNTRIVLANSC